MATTGTGGPAAAGPRCSQLSVLAGESTTATAPVARRWLALEQPGPWGRRALHESHLDRRVAADIDSRAIEAGMSVILIRRPGAHPDLRLPSPRHVYVADTTPGAAALSHAVLDDAKELLDLDFANGLGEPVADPVALVCTNARRDQCCAINGRPLAAALAANGVQAWESSHLSGHRFAATMLLLPHGIAYGRQTVPSALAAISSVRAGEVVLDGYRGRTTWPRPAQAAEIAVREATGERGLDALDIHNGEAGHGDGSEPITVRHSDGRSWRVAVTMEPTGRWRPESCGREFLPIEHFRARILA